MNITIIDELSDDKIIAAIDGWKTPEDGIFQALVKGRNLILFDGYFDHSLALKFEHVIESGQSDIVNVASLILRSLAEKYSEAQSVVVRLAKSKRVQGRIGSLLCLPPTLNEDFLDNIIKCLIFDKSEKVRVLTIDWIGRYCKTEFLSLLRVAVDSVENEKIRDYIAKEIALLRDGFYVNRQPNSIYVTMKLPDGIVGGFFNDLHGDKLSDKEVAEKFFINLKKH